jgi:uncharacterized protein YbbC (DUF1343 family)
VIGASLLLAASVATGLDAVAAGQDEALRGRRLGLLCHAASLTADGRHAIDVLRARGLDLRRLFAPEHGMRGLLAAGEKVGDGVDPASGLPVVSLYGAKTSPTAADLRDLDVLVVDLQDAGVRFYTYASTLLLALEAARAAGKGVVVLDRPNPLGGERMEGPLSDPPEVVRPSLVNRAPGPLVHGLTLGEMARLVAARRGVDPAVVIPMIGWRRSMTWDETGLRWTPPSPNLRSSEAALAYPAICLLEATNLSEGRGSDAPFLLFGAPWLAGTEWLAQATAAAREHGFDLEAASFVPRAGASATSPKHEGALCHGARVRVRDARGSRPYAFGVALLTVLRGQPEFRWRDAGAGLDWLVGSKGLHAGLAAGRSAASILAMDAKGIEAFRAERDPALLYR